jgi:hypothetical protein
LLRLVCMLCACFVVSAPRYADQLSRDDLGTSPFNLGVVHSIIGLWFAESATMSSPFEDMHACFALFDESGAGKITAENLSHALRTLGYTPSQEDLSGYGKGPFDFDQFKEICEKAVRISTAQACHATLPSVFVLRCCFVIPCVSRLTLEHLSLCSMTGFAANNRNL